MKAAILLCGQMRTFREPDVLQSLLAFFKQFEACDLFISTWDEQGVSYNHGNVQDRPDSQHPISDSLLRSTYPDVRGCAIHSLATWETSLSPEYLRMYKEGFVWSGMQIKGTMVPQLFTLWDANRLRKVHERETRQRYDVVIRCRPDVLMKPDVYRYIDEYVGISAINNPATRTFYPHRIYDIFFWGPSRFMDALCDAYNHLEMLEVHAFQNGLHPRDVCRILYVQALVHGIPVRDIACDLCIVRR